MEKSLISPNLHVALVHFPIALLIVGTLIELFSFMWRRHGFRAAGRWMILLGALLGIPTAMAGVYALNDVARMGLPTDVGDTWRDVTSHSRLDDRQWDMLSDHAWLQSEATVLAVLVAVVWIGCSDLWRRRLHLILLLLMLVACGLTIAGAWHGGEAVYRHGVGVLPYMGSSAEAEQTASMPAPKPFVVPTTAASTAPAAGMSSAASASTEPAARQSAGKVLPPEKKFNLAYVLPALQTHVILAGSIVAVALAGLGLSIRKITQGPPVTQVDHIAAALGGPPTLIAAEGEDVTGEPTHLPPSSGPDPIDVGAPRVPASRFWLLAFLLGLLTAAAGVWVLANASETWVPKDLWSFVQTFPRRLAHVINGVGLVLIPLIMAGLARWAPRQKWLLVIFTLLLVAAIVIQVWLGVLLMYDGVEGPLTHFNG